MPDTFEIVLRREPAYHPAVEAWRDACEEASEALHRWRAEPGNEFAYTRYRAAQDREDAAQDAVAQTQIARTSVS